MKKALDIFNKGLFKENPIFVLALGTCPTLAVTTSAKNGLGMGLATMAVLMGSNIVISLTRKLIPTRIRIPVFITVIAGFVTIVQLLMKAYLPDLDKALGIYIPLIVVNCIILARAEIFASRNNIGYSILDALAMGIGFAGALLILGSAREILGAGSIFGWSFAGNISPAIVMILPPGGFLAYGLIAGFINWIAKSRIPDKDCSSCTLNCPERKGVK